MRCNIARSIAGGGGAVVVGTYTGNGGTQNIEFGAAPVAVYIQDAGYQSNFATFVTQEIEIAYSNKIVAKLNGSTLTVATGGAYAINSQNGLYSYIAFF